MGNIATKNMTRCVWLTYPTSITLFKNNGTTIPIRVGDYITYEGRHLGVRVECFVGSASDIGPIGMEYLPKRADGQLAVPVWSMRGNPRFLICWPAGARKYGQHINWDTVEICISTFNNECSAEAAAMIVVEVAAENDSWADSAKIEVGVPVLNASSEESAARIVVEVAAENAGDISADIVVEDAAEFVVDPVLSMKRVCNDVEEDRCKRVRGDHSESEK
jgi:hypothetical protein